MESTRLISTCPVCHTKYEAVSAKIVEEIEGAHLLHIQCKNCGSSVVALIMIGGLGVSSVGLLCDLTPEDVAKFRQAKAISCDDVIAMHQLLQQQPDMLKSIDE